VIGASVTDPIYKMAIHQSRAGLFTWSADAAFFGFDLGKSRGATPGTHAIVQAADGLGQLNFRGSDGTTFVGAAAISGTVEGVPAAGDIRAKLTFSTRGTGGMTERMAIDTGGTVHIGTPATTGAFGLLQLDGLTGSAASITVQNWQAAAGSAFLNLHHSRGATAGTHVALQVNDPLGTVNFRGSDGTTFQLGAAITAYCEGVPSANRVPASIRFYTTSVALGTVEWMRLFPSGGLGVGNPPIDPGAPAFNGNWKGTIAADNTVVFQSQRVMDLLEIPKHLHDAELPKVIAFQVQREIAGGVANAGDGFPKRRVVGEGAQLLRQALRDRRTLVEEIAKLEQQVVVVEQIFVRLVCFVAAAKLGEIVEMLGEMEVFRFDDGGERQRLVHTSAEDVRDRLLLGKTPILAIEPHAGANELDDILGVAAVEDRETGVAANLASEAAEHEIGKGMKRSAAHPSATGAHQRSGPLEHDLRGSSSKGEQQDRGRRDAELDQSSHPVDQGPRLAAAGPRDHQHRPFKVRHRRVLSGIELRRVVDGEVRRSRLAGPRAQDVGFCRHVGAPSEAAVAIRRRRRAREGYR